MQGDAGRAPGVSLAARAQLLVVEAAPCTKSPCLVFELLIRRIARGALCRRLFCAPRAFKIGARSHAHWDYLARVCAFGKCLCAFEFEGGAKVSVICMRSHVPHARRRCGRRCFRR